jgi:molybdopterin synthase catalytic subunit
MRWRCFRRWPVGDPVSVRITAEPIDPAALLAKVGSEEDGAVVLFIGTVRCTNDGRLVTGIRYEAYREMAEGVLAEIVNEGRRLVDGARIAAVHRVGELAVGDCSVAIAASTPHRAQAFEAARYVIEEIKKRLPVWKREAYHDGNGAWLAGEQPRIEEVVSE